MLDQDVLAVELRGQGIRDKLGDWPLLSSVLTRMSEIELAYLASRIVQATARAINRRLGNTVTIEV